MTAKESLGVSAAFLTRMDETTQYLEVMESSVPLPFEEGHGHPREASFCHAVLDGRLPAVMPDVRAFPEAAVLPAVALGVRRFASVPVVLSDGTLYGTFCAAGLASDDEISQRDRALMEVLAQAASVIIEPEVRTRARESEIHDRLNPVVAAGGPVVVLQPIVDLATGMRKGAEALSRFPEAWNKAPDVCFAEAHSVGLGHRLEVLALERAADHLKRVSGYIAMNVSPSTLLTRACTDLLGHLPVERILLELSEHDPVEDYDALHAALAPLRARGMRLAIDDVGAGFSSLRHIVLTAPEVIKLDSSLVTGVNADPVLTVLVRSMVEFAHGCQARVVAEGVETAEDAAALLALGVDCGQGWHFGRPGSPEQLRPWSPVAGDEPGADHPAAA
nr:EAL domain-containing protein [Planosporangium thailandense]